MSRSSNAQIPIWGAVGPKGDVVMSSVGTFRSLAARWAEQKRGYVVAQLGAIPAPNSLDDVAVYSNPTNKPKRAEVAEAVRRQVGRPSTRRQTSVR